MVFFLKCRGLWYFSRIFNGISCRFLKRYFLGFYGAVVFWDYDTSLGDCGSFLGLNDTFSRGRFGNVKAVAIQRDRKRKNLAIGWCCSSKGATSSNIKTNGDGLKPSLSWVKAPKSLQIRLQ